MRLGDAYDDVGALGLFCPGRGQHFIGLADARRGAEKNLQPPMLGLLRLPQESLGRRAPLGVISIVHAPRYSCPHARVCHTRASALFSELVEREVEF